MSTRHDFGAYYASLGLDPGASDEDIARAKRAQNELFHADRLAHMSEVARAFAEDRVKAANHAAQVLLDPAMRAARNEWLRPRGKGPGQDDRGPDSRAAPPEEVRSTPPAAGPRRPRLLSSGFLVIMGVVGGALLGTIVFVARHTTPPRAERLPAPEPAAVAPPVPSAGRAIPNAPAIRAVLDSLIVLPADGRWTPAVPRGGPGYQASFLPEGAGANYRVKIDDGREIGMFDEPGFRGIARTGGGFRFSSLTGAPVRLRFSRWRSDTPAGTVVHAIRVVAPAGGAWGARVWLGPLRITWDPERPDGYEARTSKGRVFRVPHGVRSVAIDPLPEWIQFRAIDSALTLVVTYSIP